MTAAPTLTTGIVDLHTGDGAYDLDAFRAGGGVALIHKVTEGRDWSDRGFTAAAEGAKRAGILFGAYHFANDKDPVVQADHFLATVADHPEALLALDWETPPKGSKYGPMPVAGAVAFVERVHQQRGRWPVLYTYESVLWRWMATATPEQRTALGLCPLWLAKYGPAPKPFPASWGAWSTWSLWQYSSSVANGPSDQVTYPRGVPGFARRSQDRSVFRGDADALAVWWKACGR